MGIGLAGIPHFFENRYMFGRLPIIQYGLLKSALGVKSSEK